ncbi:MAG: hypothetical protein IJ064_05735 [Bacteroidaceae bacterium]|nr:hypothetical protein [Bacteroidaceae bacterium]
MKEPKRYTLILTRMFMYNRPNETREVEGTLEELTEYFSYTLNVGHSHKTSIPEKPKTIKSLVSAVNKSYDIKNGGMTCVELKS